MLLEAGGGLRVQQVVDDDTGDGTSSGTSCNADARADSDFGELLEGVNHAAEIVGVCNSRRSSSNFAINADNKLQGHNITGKPY